MSSRLLRSPSDQAVSSPGQEYFVLFLGKTIYPHSYTGEVNAGTTLHTAGAREI